MVQPNTVAESSDTRDAGGVPFGLRLKAALIDTAVILGALALGFFLLAMIASTLPGAENDDSPIWMVMTLVLFGLALAVPAVYYVWLESGSGSTLGKRAVGLEVVNTATGLALNRAEATRRHVYRVMAGLPFGAGLLTAVKPSGLAWHDRLSGSAVVLSPGTIGTARMAAASTAVTAAAASPEITTGPAPATTEDTAPPATEDAAPEAANAGPATPGRLDRAAADSIVQGLLTHRRWPEAAAVLRRTSDDGPAQVLEYSRAALRASWPREALRTATVAVVKDPGNATAHAIRALALLQLEGTAAAREAAAEAERLDPSLPLTGAALALVAAFEGRTDAVAIADRYLTAHPGDDHLLVARFEAAFRLGLNDDLTATAAAMLAAHPDDPYSHVCAGAAALRRGERSQAVQHYLQALRMEPQHDWAREAIVDARGGAGGGWAVLGRLVLGPSRLGRFARELWIRPYGRAVALIGLIMLLPFALTTPLVSVPLLAGVAAGAGILVRDHRRASKRRAAEFGPDGMEWLRYLEAINRLDQLAKTNAPEAQRQAARKPPVAPASSVLHDPTICRCNDLTTLYAGPAVRYANLHLGQINDVYEGVIALVCPTTGTRWTALDAGFLGPDSAAVLVKGLDLTPTAVVDSVGYGHYL